MRQARSYYLDGKEFTQSEIDALAESMSEAVGLNVWLEYLGEKYPQTNEEFIQLQGRLADRSTETKLIAAIEGEQSVAAREAESIARRLA